jgi:hypothetical protein
MTERRAPGRRHVSRNAELLDVQLLDVVAQIEALLRNSREIQYEALRVRGVPADGTRAQRVAAAAKIPKIIAQMERDQRALAKVLRGLRKCADQLHKSVRTPVTFTQPR